MPLSIKVTEDLLNTIAAALPSIDKSDLAGLAVILTKMETISGQEGLPKALKTLALRTVDLINNIIMAETDFDAGCKKLGDCVIKMRKGLEEGKGAKAQRHGDAGQQSEGAKREEEMPEDLKDLLIKFAGSQQSVLEDFEAYILEFEKGDPEAKGAIKRVLHTWKGEFGVLDLRDYSGLIHAVEDGFEDGRIHAEQLFKFKDFLQTVLSRATSGVMPVLSSSDNADLLPPANIAEGVSAARQTPSVKQPKINTEALSAGPDKPGPIAKDALQPQSYQINADPSLLADFVHESRDHIHTAETVLLELETDPSNSENINGVFRAWHTIKGVAGFLGLKETSSLAHSMENLMDKARKQELTLNAEYIDMLLEGNDCLKEFVASVERTISGEPFSVPESYASIIEKLASPVLPGKNAGVPPAAPEKRVGELLLENGTVAPEDIRKALKLQQEGDGRKLGEILIAEKNIPARSVANALASQSAGRQAASVEETIRVPVGRIDQLVDSIGEAVIAQSMINADPSIKVIQDQTLTTKIAHSEMILRQIQELAMSLRMVSIKSTFQKMARLVRDLAKKSGKEVNFVTEGEDTELDKSVVENIGDPLIHMIRNSVDHGVESAEERKLTNKPPVATVVLKAYHKAGSIFIEVVDDGKGLDKTAIFEKAVSKGLCKKEDNFSDQEIFAFIFLPGFSTAKVVTDVSGRGVGMDVVRRNIEALRGSVEIQSEPGKGTTFSIRLPLTLAIVDGMIIRSGDDSYIIPTLSILESIKPAPDQRKTVLEKGEIINVRGELIPLVNLAKVFKKNNGNAKNVDEIVMIVEDMFGKKIGLEIDEILGQQQVVIKNLGAGIGDVPGVSGGAIMSDGRVSLILDVGGISKMVEG